MLLFIIKNYEVDGKKIAGLSAASDMGKSLLFHTSLLVNFNIPLMLEIMNTPLVKLHDKGYNCFSQRMTTVRQESKKDIFYSLFEFQVTLSYFKKSKSIVSVS